MMSKAQAKFNLKFDSPRKPGDAMPTLPEELDVLSDGDLMSQYAEMVSWVNYAKSELVHAEIIEENALSALRHGEALALLEQWEADSKGDTVTMAKARRDVDPTVREYHQRHHESRAYRKLVDTVFDRGERNATVLSRELSRRISLTPNERKLQWTGA
jgi:hypothetical protein